MSAAHSASRAVHPHAAPAARAAAPRPARSAAPTLNSPERSDEFKLNLADLPRSQESLEVEGFKPSLLSRLLDLVAPTK
jgi:hypothetical protein